MKKVGIIFFHNLRYAPFVKYYTDILDSLNDIQYDIIYYNRDKKLNEPKNGKYIPVPWIGKGTNIASKFEKGINFIFWKIYVSNLLKKKKYDFIIIIMTMPAVLLERELIKNYDKKFIIDIRDYTYENIRWFAKSEERLVKHSRLNIISSPGFKKFLPNAHYEVCHNFAREDEINNNINFVKKVDFPIQISYIGSISYEEECLKLIDLVKDDNRFSFVFYGNENTSHIISKKIKKLSNNRIKMMGPFLPEEKENIYRKSALVFNCYGNDRPLVLYAISNKHYDGALYKVPVLNSPGTIMAKLAGGNGYELDLEKINNLNGLYDWYNALNKYDYEKYANNVIKNAIKENENTRAKIISSILE